MLWLFKSTIYSSLKIPVGVVVNVPYFSSVNPNVRGEVKFEYPPPNYLFCKSKVIAETGKYRLLNNEIRFRLVHNIAILVIFAIALLLRNM